MEVRSVFGDARSLCRISPAALRAMQNYRHNTQIFAVSIANVVRVTLHSVLTGTGICLPAVNTTLWLKFRRQSAASDSCHQQTYTVGFDLRVRSMHGRCDHCCRRGFTIPPLQDFSNSARNATLARRRSHGVLWVQVKG